MSNTVGEKSKTSFEDGNIFNTLNVGKSRPVPLEGHEEKSQAGLEQKQMIPERLKGRNGIYGDDFMA